MARERVVDVYIPVVPPSAGVGGVGPILILPVVIAAATVVLAVLVAVAYPTPHHRYYDRPCDPFCSASTEPTAPQYPFGGEQR